MSARLDRRRFLAVAASAAAAGALIACGRGATSRTVPTPESKAGGAAPAATSAPAAAPPTVAPLQVQTQATAAATAAPAAAGATTAPGAAATKPATAPGKYNEAPDLAQMVKDGKLTPVEKRLPDNPRVIKPLEETGQYGGVWHRAWRGISDRLAIGKLMEERLIEWDAPDSNTIRLVANFVEKWEQSKDATEFTFYMRKGVKWSDGTEATTDDVKFWMEDVQLNKDLTPAISTNLIRIRIGNEYKMADVTVVDKYTWKVKFAGPNPLLTMYIAKSGGNPQGIEANPGFFIPSHYYKKFHPKYADKAALDKLAAEKKVASWTELWGKGGQMDGPIGHYVLNPDVPVLTAWKMTRVLPTDPVRMERNPYYWQVDDQGNQLPYIDAVEHRNYENTEVFKLWLAQGQIDCQNRGIEASAFTFLKENEQKGGYRVLQWRSASTEAYFPNQNAPDKVLAELFGKADFRQALNLAVNRKEISDVVYNGLAKPRQYSPVKGSPEYDEGMESAWAQYDPKKANDLLDGLGLKKGADGVRQRPDGKPLEVTIEHISPSGSAALDMHNLIVKYWGAIGIKAAAKQVDRTLYTEHVHNGEIEVGQWGFDRSSVVRADPHRWTGVIDDGPWAPLWGHFYNQDPWKKEEPPKDAWIRKVWDLWDQSRAEPDDAKSLALFMQLIKLHREAPIAVGTVGEAVAPWVVKNNFRNVKGGYIQDDTLRDYGLINPQQFFFKK